MTKDGAQDEEESGRGRGFHRNSQGWIARYFRPCFIQPTTVLSPTL